MPAQENARLTAVTGPSASTGGRDDWFDGAGQPTPSAPATKWQGSAGAYLQEKVRRGPGPGGAEVTFARILFVDSKTARAAGIKVGDVVAYVGPDGLAVSARADIVAISELPGLPREVQTARIELGST